MKAPEDLFLRLSVNSTRKAKWFAKLGFLKTKRPLSISLDSIKANSNVGAVDVVVERIYPMQYFETKADGAKICRNQKQEEMLSIKAQTDYENKNYKNNCHDDGDIDYELKENATLANKCRNSANSHSNQRDQQQKPLQVQRNVKQILKIRLVDASKKKTCKHIKK